MIFARLGIDRARFDAVMNRRRLSVGRFAIALNAQLDAGRGVIKTRFESKQLVSCGSFI